MKLKIEKYMSIVTALSALSIGTMFVNPTIALFIILARNFLACIVARWIQTDVINLYAELSKDRHVKHTAMCYHMNVISMLIVTAIILIALTLYTSLRVSSTLMLAIELICCCASIIYLLVVAVDFKSTAKSLGLMR